MLNHSEDVEYSEDFSDEGDSKAPFSEGERDTEKSLEGDWNNCLDPASVHDLTTFTGDNEGKDTFLIKEESFKQTSEIIHQRNYINSLLPVLKTANLNRSDREISPSTQDVPNFDDDKVNDDECSDDSSIFIPNEGPKQMSNAIIKDTKDIESITVPPYSGDIEYPEDFENEDNLEQAKDIALQRNVSGVVSISKALSNYSMEDDDWDNYMDDALSSHNDTYYDDIDDRKKIEESFPTKVDDLKHLNDRINHSEHADTLQIKNIKDSQFVANTTFPGDTEYPEDFNKIDDCKRVDDAVSASKVSRADSKDLDENLDNSCATILPFTNDEENEYRCANKIDDGENAKVFLAKDEGEQIDDSLPEHNEKSSDNFSVRKITATMDNYDKEDDPTQIIGSVPQNTLDERHLSVTEIEELNNTSHQSLLTEDWEKYLITTSDHDVSSNGVDEYQLDDDDDNFCPDNDGDDELVPKEASHQIDEIIIENIIDDTVPFIEVLRKDSSGLEIPAPDNLEDDQIISTNNNIVAIDNNKEGKYHIDDDGDKSYKSLKRENSTDALKKKIEETRSLSVVIENTENNYIDGIQNINMGKLPISPMPSHSNQAQGIFDNTKTKMNIENAIKVCTSTAVIRLIALLGILRKKTDEIKMLVNETDMYWRKQIEIKQQKITIELQFMKSLQSSHTIKCRQDVTNENTIKLSKRYNSRQQLQQGNNSGNCHYSALTDSSKGKIRTNSIDHLRPKQLQQYVEVSSSNSQSNCRHALEVMHLSLRALFPRLDTIHLRQLSKIRSIILLAENSIDHAVKMHSNIMTSTAGKESRLQRTRKAVAVDDAGNVLKYNIKSLADFCNEISVSHLAISTDLEIITTTDYVANINKSSKKWLTNFNPISDSDAVIKNGDKADLFLDLNVKQDGKMKKFKRKKRYKVPEQGDEKRKVMLDGKGLEIDRDMLGGKQRINDEYHVDSYDSDNSLSYEVSLLNDSIPETDILQREQEEDDIHSSVLSNLSMIAHEPLIMEDVFDIYVHKNDLEIEGIERSRQNIFGQTRHTFTTKGADRSCDTDSNIDKNGYNETVMNNVRKTFPVANRNRNHWISGRVEASVYLNNKNRIKILSQTFQRSVQRPASAPAARRVDVPEMVELNSKSIQEISKRDLPSFNIFPCQYCLEHFRGKGKFIPQASELDRVLQHTEEREGNQIRTNKGKTSHLLHISPYVKLREKERYVQRISLSSLEFNNLTYSKFSSLKPFCSWECAKKYSNDFGPKFYKEYLDIHIDLAAGYNIVI